MIVTAHQPVYLPWLGLFHKIALSDTYCYLDDVQYQVNDWNNRNQIKTANGPLWLTVPMLHRGHLDKKINDMHIDNTQDWRRKHWRALQQSYSKAPFFNDYTEFFESVYSREWDRLSDLNEHMLLWFLKTLGIQTAYTRSSDLVLLGKKSDLVLELCQKLKASTYISGALGRDYLKVGDFEKEKIKVNFQDYQHPVYPQLYGDFVPYMSIVDLMFNCGEKSLEILMSGNRMKA